MRFILIFPDPQPDIDNATLQMAEDQIAAQLRLGDKADWQIPLGMIKGAIAAFALSRWTPLSLVLIFGSGVSSILIFNLANALVQTNSPDALRGRIMGVYTLTFFGLMPETSSPLSDSPDILRRIRR